MDRLDKLDLALSFRGHAHLALHDFDGKVSPRGRNVKRRGWNLDLCAVTQYLVPLDADCSLARLSVQNVSLSLKQLHQGQFFPLIVHFLLFYCLLSLNQFSPLR